MEYMRALLWSNTMQQGTVSGSGIFFPAEERLMSPLTAQIISSWSQILMVAVTETASALQSMTKTEIFYGCKSLPEITMRTMGWGLIQTTTSMLLELFMGPRNLARMCSQRQPAVMRCFLSNMTLPATA